MSMRKKLTQDYTIKITNSDDSVTRKIKISSNLFKYGVGSIIICVLLLIGGLGFAGYTLFMNKINQTNIAQLQKANSTQQEKITGLSKKATELETSLIKMTSEEQKLNQLSNINISNKSS